MEGILIVNGSPRAPRSNSKLYAEAFMKGWRKGAEYMNLTLINHQAIIEKIGSGAYREVLFVFPFECAVPAQRKYAQRYNFAVLFGMFQESGTGSSGQILPEGCWQPFYII